MRSLTDQVQRLESQHITFFNFCQGLEYRVGQRQTAQESALHRVFEGMIRDQGGEIQRATVSSIFNILFFSWKPAFGVSYVNLRNGWSQLTPRGRKTCRRTSFHSWQRGVSLGQSGMIETPVTEPTPPNLAEQSVGAPVEVSDVSVVFVPREVVVHFFSFEPVCGGSLFDFGNARL